MARLYPNLELIYLPNQININTKIKKNTILDNNIKRLHYVGRLSPEKNIPMLLNAMQQISNINVNVKLYLYGEGTSKYSKYLEYLCEYYKINEKVCFMGNIVNIDEIYSDADFIILPSVHEGIPYCLLEAQLFNIPIISHNISGIEEYIKSDFFYEYDRIDKTVLNDILYIKNYNILLKMIGYIEFVITKKMQNIQQELFDVLKILGSEDGKLIFGTKITIPPNIAKIKNEIYDNNVDILVNIIKKAILYSNIKKLK